MVLEALGEIDAMLRELPPKVAHAFVMAVACEMTDNEVAAPLHVSSRMVRKYVAQAMLCCMKLEARLAAGQPETLPIAPASAPLATAS
ncbi:hypothetical protein G6F59_018803 [Rhizopus arrhizus]|nr:hypothetical protein G6F59_018803 [Rhizopus arrhizus]